MLVLPLFVKSAVAPTLKNCIPAATSIAPAVSSVHLKELLRQKKLVAHTQRSLITFFRSSKTIKLSPT